MSYTIQIREKSARVTLVDWCDTTGSLTSLHADLRGAGHGTAAMKRAISVSDAIGIRILFLLVSPFGEGVGPDVAQLTEFYKEFGFISAEGDPTLMIRTK